MTAIRVCATHEDDPALAADALANALGPDDASLVVFFSSFRYPFQALAALVAERFPGAVTVGCTTAGEIGPDGCTVGGISAVSLSAPCVARATVVDLEQFHFEDGESIVQDLSKQLGRDISPGEHVFITLTDGLSGMEEILIASLGTYAPGVRLVGGSAADDWQFKETWVAADGVAKTGAAVVLLLQPGVPFHTFHLHHFEPTQTRFVVTGADAQKRLVHELDGRPAADTLARHMGIPVDQLGDPNPQQLPTFAFHIGDRYYMRSVMTVQGSSLLMGGAVEEGSILRLMTGLDLIDATRDGVERALARVPGDAAAMILFNCAGRLIEAQLTGRVDGLYDAMSPVPTAGFTTYGEQYGPMQVNHTLTGLVLGANLRHG